MSKSHGWRHCLWLTPLTFTLAGPVSAQAPDADSVALDEVVVTARKREENVIVRVKRLLSEGLEKAAHTAVC